MIITLIPLSKKRYINFIPYKLKLTALAQSVKTLILMPWLVSGLF